MLSPSPRSTAVAGLIAMAAAMGVGRFIYTPILPFMTEGLGLSKSQAGLIAGANFTGYLLGALGAASTRFGGPPRAWLLGALALSALSTGAMAAGHTLAIAMALRFIGGMASAFVLVFASTLVLERLNAAGRGSLSAVHFAGVGVGMAVTALLVWCLEATGHDWRTMWLGGGLISLAAVPLVAALLPGVAEVTPVRTSGRAQAAAAPQLRRLIVAYGLFGFGYVITATFLVAIVRGSAEARPLETLIWLTAGLAAIPSVALWSGLGHHIGVLRAFAVACLVEAVGVFASVIWVNVTGLFVAALFLGGTLMGITALGLVGARGLALAGVRTVLAGMTAAFGFGQVIGPVAAGYLFDVTGSFFLPTTLAAAALCVAALLVVGLKVPVATGNALLR